MISSEYVYMSSFFIVFLKRNTNKKTPEKTTRRQKKKERITIWVAYVLMNAYIYRRFSLV